MLPQNSPWMRMQPQVLDEMGQPIADPMAMAAQPLMGGGMPLLAKNELSPRGVVVSGSMDKAFKKPQPKPIVKAAPSPTPPPLSSGGKVYLDANILDRFKAGYRGTK